MEGLVSGAPGRLYLDLPTPLPQLDADPDLLGVLLHNLLENALKYAPAPSPVALVVTVAGPRLVLEVRDQGPGIPPEEQGQVFETYQRGSAVHGIPGAGLGLALVARIAELHRGRVELDSTPGQGTRVRVYLPLRQPQGGAG